MNKPSTQPMTEQDRRKRNALVISLITGILFTIVSAILGPIAYAQNGISGLWGVVATVVVALAGFIGAFQIFRKRVSFGIGILITTILVMALTLPVVAQGQGIALGMMILIFVAGISTATLPPIWSTRAIIIAFVIAAIIAITDLYLPDFGLPTQPGYTNLIAVIVSVVYVFFILRQFNTFSLRIKIILAFILVTIIPVLVLSVINGRSSSAALETQSKTQLTSLSKIVADKVDGFITTQLNSVRTDAKQFALTSYLELPALSREGSVEEKNARLTLLSFTFKDPVFIRSIALLNAGGINVLDTLNENKNRYEGTFDYFNRPIYSGLPYVSNIVFYEGRPSIYFSAPIKNTSGETIGVLRIEYYATVIQSLVRSVNPGNPGVIVALVDSNTYLRTGYTGSRDELFKSYFDYADLELSILQANSRLPEGPKENAVGEPDNTTVAGINNLQQEPFFNSYSLSLGSDSINTGIFLKTQPWVALVRQSTITYLQSVKEQNRTNTLLSLFMVSFSIVAGFIVSQVLTSPLTTLTKAAEKVTSGDLQARAQVTVKDEIGTLATAFNRMTDQLNQTLTGLEQRVIERTTDLELSRQQSVKRANELQSIGEISKIITSEQKLENLLPLITRLVSERFGFYHTGIFLIDNTNRYAVLQAANSEGGRNMLKRQHKLEVGGSGIVGYVAKSGLPRISLDVGHDAVFFDNPDLPTTRSEMALPLKVRERTVGVLDVQSEKPGAFTENDTNTLTILADQVAIALENARLFDQAQQALNEAQVLYRQNLKEGWKTFRRENEIVGYQQNLMSGKKLTQFVETDEIRESLKHGDILVINADGGTQEASIVVPIKLRGQIIGNMNIKAPTKGRKWSTDEVTLAETISERLSVALENARLIEQSQRQVIKEQTISDITGKIGASINLKNVLQTAVEELGRAMPGSEVLIQFKSDEK
jgi:GAF domain-containing protein/HAMP domain-containing protein